MALGRWMLGLQQMERLAQQRLFALQLLINRIELDGVAAAPDLAAPRAHGAEFTLKRSGVQSTTGEEASAGLHVEWQVQWTDPWQGTQRMALRSRFERTPRIY